MLKSCHPNSASMQSADSYLEKVKKLEKIKEKQGAKGNLKAALSTVSSLNFGSVIEDDN